MPTRATLKYARISPRKARLIADFIRGVRVNEAEAKLMLSPKRAAAHILKLLRSAIANAKAKGVAAEALFVKEIRVDGGPQLKRWRARARGTAGKIQKKTSHITLVLEEGASSKKQRFVILKNKKEKIHEHAEGTKARPGVKKEKAEKEIEKKNSDVKTGKRKFFQRKSV